VIEIKILLVNSPTLDQIRFDEPVYPPLGILYIASYLRENLDDVSLRVIDGARIGFGKTLKIVEREDADVLSLSFTTWSSTGAFELINKIKENNPDTFIITGGPHSTAMPNEVLKRSNTDMAVIGEGEKTMLEIKGQLDGDRDFRKIDGLAFREGDDVIITKPREYLDVDYIPFPARDLINIKLYPGLFWSKTPPETNILSSRGCMNNCTFCSNPVWKTNSPWLRLRSPENIVDEIVALQSEFGIKEVSDECDSFNTDLKWATEVCKKMKSIDISWKVQIRAKPMTDELAKSMAKSGCWLVRIGVESSNLSTLKGIRKGITINDFVQTCKKLKKYDIKVVGLFMIFNVWEENGKLKFESIRMCKNTFKFIENMLKKKLIDSFGWAFTTPFPGSELYRIAKKYDLIQEEDYQSWNQVSDFVMKLPGVDKRDINRMKFEGMMLQAKNMLIRQDFNSKVIKLYLRRAILMSKYFLKQN
jgi:radical SAM superfamily enzyme YgiQ (UPF0313 family)